MPKKRTRATIKKRTRKSRTTRKKRKVSRVKRGTTVDRANWAVYRYAFSTATSHPKIPDGRSNISSGLKLQCIESHNVPQSGTLHVLLIPGLKTSLISGASKSLIDAINELKAAEGTTDTNRIEKAKKDLAAYEGGGHKHWALNISDHAAASFDKNAANGPTLTQTGSEINSWRMVSSALRVSLLNNADENEGWYEMIRVPLSQHQHGLTFDDDGYFEATKFDVTGKHPDFYLPFVDTTKNIVDHPTYRSGLLRDINKRVFQLHVSEKFHDFQHLRPTMSFTQNGTTFETVMDFNPLLDRSFECIYLRFHGNQYAKEDTSSYNTRLLFHTVSNQEVVYDEGTELARHMQRNTM